MDGLTRLGLIGVGGFASLLWAAQAAHANPQPPMPQPALRGPRTLLAVDCPSPAQCTAVDRSRAMTFSPGGPYAPQVTVLPVPLGDTLVSVSCPTSRQCTALTASGAETTFTPGALGVQRLVPLFGRSTVATSIACPSSTICTAVGGRREVTFNPLAPSERIAARLGLDVAAVSGVVACPSTGQCTVTGERHGAGRVVTFATGSTAPGPSEALGFTPSGLACIVDQCTATGSTQALTFDPSPGGNPMPAPVTLVSGASTPLLSGGVACPTVGACMAPQSGPALLGFNPNRRAPGRTVAVAGSGALTALACPEASVCVATDGTARPVVVRF